MLRNLWLDWKDMCSKDNRSSRGFYLFVSVVYIAIVVGFVAVLAALALGFIPKDFVLLSVLGSIGAIVLAIGSFIWLAKQK